MPFSAFGATDVPPERFTQTTASLSECVAMVPLPATGCPAYLAIHGRGESSVVTAARSGIACSVDNAVQTFRKEICNFFSLPSLERPGVDALCIMSHPNKSNVMVVTEELKFQITPSKFIDQERTLECRVFHHAYAQITLHKVLLTTLERVVALWEAPAGNTITCGWIGEEYIIVATDAKEVICLQFDEMQSSDHFVELEKKLMKAEVTCVMEYKHSILIGTIDRSVIVCSVNRNVLEDRTPILLESIPRFVYSFCVVPQSNGQVVSSSDDCVLIGSDAGMLYYVSLDEKTSDCNIIYKKSLAKTRLFCSPVVLHGMAAIVVSSDSSYQLIYRSNPFVIHQIYFVVKDVCRDKFATASTHRLGNLFVYHTQRLELTVMWYEDMLLVVSFGLSSMPISMYSFSTHHTGRRLIPLPQGKVLVVSHDVKPNRPTSNYWTIFALNEYNALLSESLTGLCQADEYLSACCVFNRKANEGLVRDWIVVGSVGPQKCHLRLFRRDLTNRISRVSTCMECSKQHGEADHGSVGGASAVQGAGDGHDRRHAPVRRRRVHASHLRDQRAGHQAGGASPRRRGKEL